jgi:hypothetical protein
MPSFRVPITRAFRDPDPAGPIRTFLRAAVDVEARTRTGRFRPVRVCVVDTGASYTMMSTEQARILGVDVPPAAVRMPLTTASRSGTAAVRDGELRLRFDALPGHTFRLYCLFVDDLPVNTPLLLGLNDFLDVFRVTFDGGFSRDAPAGRMLFETV